jgi:2-polyprenyl-3-methyl-5-hydroxy-6-metoxy-1,4-benzoquinol methylase
MNKAEQFWDKLADSFDKSEDQFDKIHVATIENTKKYLKASDVVLDYGCATGNKSFALADYVKKLKGIDISSKMIELAKRKAAEREIKNIDFSHALIFDESLKKESFEAVLAFNILHAVKENRKALDRINELIKPGGLFISTTPCLKEKVALPNKLLLLSYLILIKLGFVPNVLSRFKIHDLVDLVKSGNFEILKTEKLYHKITGYFIVAKKI